MRKIILYPIIAVMALLLLACSVLDSFGKAGLGDFSVALAARVAGASEIIPAGPETGGRVLGLGVKVAAVKAVADSNLAVWLVNPTYVNDDGSPKNDAEGKPYVINWNAYDPAADPKVSVVAKLAGPSVVFLQDTVLPARKIVKLGSDLLVKPAGVVLLAQVYPPGTGADAMGLGRDKARGSLAQYRLTISQQDKDFNFSHTSIVAQGFAANNPPDRETLKGKAAVAAAVDIIGADTDYGRARLALSSSASAGQAVAFNGFTLKGVAADEGLRFIAMRGAVKAWQVLGTTVSAEPGREATEGRVLVNPASPSEARADFTAEPSGTGHVELWFEDRYGCTGSLEVTLDPSSSAKS